MNKTLEQLLPFFNPDELPDSFFILVLASRRGGKTTMIADMILNYWSQKYDIIVGLMGNPATAGHYIKSGCISEKYCHSNYDPKVLENWFDITNKKLKKGIPLQRTLFILDDVLRLNSQKKTKVPRYK